MIGYIGLGLLLLAYIMLITRWDYLFIPLDILASAILTIYALIYVKDIPLTLVNGLITIILTIRFIRNKTL